jgi:hypothetical protein
MHFENSCLEIYLLKLPSRDIFLGISCLLVNLDLESPYIPNQVISLSSMSSV